MHLRNRLVYFYHLRVNFLAKASTSGRCDQVWLSWQRYICRSRYGCFCSSLQVTYLHTKIEGGSKIFSSNFASLSWRIALNGTEESAHLIHLSNLIKSLPIISSKDPLEIEKNFLSPSKGQIFSQLFCVAHS